MVIDGGGVWVVVGLHVDDASGCGHSLASLLNFIYFTLHSGWYTHT